MIKSFRRFEHNARRKNKATYRDVLYYRRRGLMNDLQRKKIKLYCNPKRIAGVLEQTYLPLNVLHSRRIQLVFIPRCSREARTTTAEGW